MSLSQPLNVSTTMPGATVNTLAFTRFTSTRPERLTFGRGVATDAADTDHGAARQFIGAAVLQRVGGAA